MTRCSRCVSSRESETMTAAAPGSVLRESAAFSSRSLSAVSGVRSWWDASLAKPSLLLQQLFQPVCHPVEGPGEGAQLGCARLLVSAGGKVAFCQQLRGFLQPLDSPRDGIGHQVGDQPGEQHRGCGHCPHHLQLAGHPVRDHRRRIGQADSAGDLLAAEDRNGDVQQIKPEGLRVALPRCDLAGEGCCYFRAGSVRGVRSRTGRRRRLPRRCRRA